MKMQYPSAKIVCFSGESNSGKTTLICKLATLLRLEGAKVAIIKHDPKDKSNFDEKGKDSTKFSEIATSVALISPKKSVVISKNPAFLADCPQEKLDSHSTSPGVFEKASAYEMQEFTRMLDIFIDYDYILIEGLKFLPYRKIIVAREKLNLEYMKVGNVFALSTSLKRESKPLLSVDSIILDLDNEREILDFIKENF